MTLISVPIRTCSEGHTSLDAANWLCPWCELAAVKADCAHYRQSLELTEGVLDSRNGNMEEILRENRRLLAEVDALKSDIARHVEIAAREAQARIKIEQDWRTWGVIEVAVRNPNVASFMKHWEDRAIKAEQALAEAQKDAERYRWLRDRRISGGLLPTN